MAVYKRWYGKKIKPGHPNYDEARWYVEFRLQGVHVLQAVPTARTRANALSAESKLKEDAYNRRYGRGARQIGFTAFFDNHYLPWVKEKRKSYRDYVSRGQDVKAYFGDSPIRDIGPFEIEECIRKLSKKVTNRKTKRKPATVNRYLSLLGGCFKRAKREGYVDFNPCADMEKGEEHSRHRYLKPDEDARFREALTGDLEFLVAPLDIALNAGLRKEELVKIKQGDLNFSNASMFHPCGIEVFPNWMAIPESKNGKPRQVPMNRIVREKLSAAAVGAKPDELIFTFKRNGVSWSTIRTGFERACENANVVHGQTVNGGITWHDLRRTFATRLRALGIHEYDIKDLLGHTIAGVTSTYARLTPDVLENAVERLAETKGKVVKFERKVS